MGDAWGSIDNQLNDLLSDLDATAAAPAAAGAPPAAAGAAPAATGGATSELDAILDGLGDLTTGTGTSDAFSFTAPPLDAMPAPAPDPAPAPAVGAGAAALLPPAAGAGAGGAGAALPPPVSADTAGLPLCGGCGQPVAGQCLNAIGKSWHMDHFACARCKRAFGAMPFFEHEGKPYCERDYNELFAVRCAACMRPIEAQCITAMGKKWHPDHFRCAGCDTMLAGKPYVEREGKALCKDCKARMDAEADGQTEIHQCGKCGKPIYGEYVMLQGQYIHPEHFSCAECGAPLKGGQCFEYDNNFYCEYDYNKLMQNQCAGCKKVIDGRALSAIGRQWHPECFRCCVCEASFAVGSFFEKDGKPYCETHYYKLFGDLCQSCQKPIAGQGLKAMGLQWHQEHFNCVGCGQNLHGKVFKEMEQKPMCKKCYNKLPSDVRKKAEKAKDARVKAEKEHAKAAAKAAKAAKAKK